MKPHVLKLTLLLSAALAGGSLAQHGPQGPPHQPGEPQGGPSAQSGQRRGGSSAARDQVREQDRDRLRDCTSAADRTRKQARDMSRAMQGEAAGPEQARLYRNQVREELQKLEQQHERFARGLEPGQRTQLEAQLREMDQAREQVREHLGAIDEAVGQGQLDRQRLQEQAREMERDLARLRRQYRDLGGS